MSKTPLADAHSLSHTKWNCKYHVVFAPKYRRKAFYGERRQEIGAILRKLCEWKGVNILKAEVCIDHVHMLLEIPPKMSVSSFMGYLKGKSSLMIFEKWGNPSDDHVTPPWRQGTLSPRGSDFIPPASHTAKSAVGCL